MRLVPIALIAVLTACTAEAPEREDVAGAPANVSAPATTPMPPAESPSAKAAAASLTAEGWGPLRIGMTRAQIVTAFGEDADSGAVGGPDPAACDQFRPQRAPQDMLVMVVDGKLTRISLIRDADIATDRGLRLGDDAAKVRTAYGDAVRSAPHAYLAPEGAYLTIWTRGGGEDVRDPTARGIRYEIGSDDRVTAIHAGGPAIQFVEGCA